MCIGPSPQRSKSAAFGSSIGHIIIHHDFSGFSVVKNGVDKKTGMRVAIKVSIAWILHCQQVATQTLQLGSTHASHFLPLTHVEAQMLRVQVVERARYQRGDESLQRETDILKMVGIGDLCDPNCRQRLLNGPGNRLGDAMLCCTPIDIR